VVSRDPDGMLHFVERKKNIIRRSGENIAAADASRRAAGRRDGGQGRLRDEQVLACIVLKHGMPTNEAAGSISGEISG
jgi:crotonobetaine/carnitine-CoA ligase